MQLEYHLEGERSMSVLDAVLISQVRQTIEVKCDE